MKFYWMGNNEAGNFGDVLTPHLLKHFNIPYMQVSKHANEFDAMCIGSIARFARPSTIVLGSGFLSKKNNVCCDADYRFVRGPLSRNMILAAGGSCPEIYGDPAMLLPLFCEESTKEYDIGFIPHETHYQRVKELYPDEFVINLMTSNALDTAREISKCRSVVSGSLHGIIAANAYGIPAAWVNLGGIKGDGIKFEDHFLSVGIEDAVMSDIADPIFYSSTFDSLTIEDIFKLFSTEFL